jgi:predicted metal-dependent phosphoesterase TrpH
VIRVDLHLHSSASFDCKVEPAAVARRCKSFGLSPVVLTDHDTIEGALELWRDDPESVLVGQEISTTEGELIGLFLESPIPSRVSPEEAVLRVKAQGGLVYLQHPYDLYRRRLSEDAIERLSGRIDIVEVFNGRSDEEANRKADDLCVALGVARGAGSDAHTVGEIGSTYVEMHSFAGAEDFLQKLWQGRIVRRPNRLRLRAEARLRSTIRPR